MRRVKRKVKVTDCLTKKGSSFHHDVGTSQVASQLGAESFPRPDVVGNSEQSFHNVPIMSEECEVEATESHYKSKEAIVQSWENTRHLLDQKLIERLAPPVQTKCVVCTANLKLKDIERPLIRCLDCGPQFFLCEPCASETHEMRPLHKLEIYQDGCFQCWQQKQTLIFEHETSSDCHAYTKAILIYNVEGCQLPVLARFCACEPEGVTLLRNDLWPNTPVNVHCAYHVRLMERLWCLTMECHLSVWGFCQSLSLQHQWSIQESATMYKMLQSESWYEYQYATDRILRSQESETCRACPEENPLISVDANFGLTRKKTSGHSLRPPQHGNRMFFNNEEVQSYVTQHNEGSQEEACNQFQTLTALRSAKRDDFYDVKGVFGAVCRHEVPLKFMDLYHGEKLAYPKFLVRFLKEKYSSITLTYDIGCALQKNVDKDNCCKDLLNNVRVAVPVFHAFAHSVLCQMNYSPRYVLGLANADGEGIERLWSYLRPFSKITRTMTSSHRVDLLTEALLNYARRKNACLGRAIRKRYDFATKQSATAQAELDALQSDISSG